MQKTRGQMCVYNYWWYFLNYTIIICSYVRHPYVPKQTQFFNTSSFLPSLWEVLQLLHQLVTILQIDFPIHNLHFHFSDSSEKLASFSCLLELFVLLSLPDASRKVTKSSLMYNCPSSQNASTWQRTKVSFFWVLQGIIQQKSSNRNKNDLVVTLLLFKLNKGQ